MVLKAEQASDTSEFEFQDITAWILIPIAAVQFGMAFTMSTSLGVAFNVGIGTLCTLFLINDRLVKILRALNKS